MNFDDPLKQNKSENHDELLEGENPQLTSDDRAFFEKVLIPNSGITDETIFIKPDPKEAARVKKLISPDRITEDFKSADNLKQLSLALLGTFNAVCLTLKRKANVLGGTPYLDVFEKKSDYRRALEQTKLSYELFLLAYRVEKGMIKMEELIDPKRQKEIFPLNLEELGLPSQALFERIIELSQSKAPADQNDEFQTLDTAYEALTEQGNQALASTLKAKQSID